MQYQIPEGTHDLAIEAMHRAYRVLTGQPDEILDHTGLQRAHHRILYVLGRNPGCSVTRVCELLRISRQAINGPLRMLTAKQLVRVRKGEQDSRVKLMSLTPQGERLERQLTDSMRGQFDRAFREAGPEAQAGWFAVMSSLVTRMPAAAPAEDVELPAAPRRGNGAAARPSRSAGRKATAPA